MYSELVARDGIIALHDIVYHPHNRECQVWKLWNELKQKYKTTREIISSTNQIWAGIGIVQR